MSTTSPFTYRRRLGRCPSPPTWAWYEQIPFAEDDSDNTDSEGDDDSSACSEDDNDSSYESGNGGGDRPVSPSESGSSSEGGGIVHRSNTEGGADAHQGAVDAEMSEKVDHEGTDQASEAKKDIKGKQRAVDPPEGDESPRRRERRKKHREPVIKFRPILTIQRSHGFVWNQDLFVPPYIKDRYVASTSPPDQSGCLSSYNDYEVDVVEIRVKEGEFANIIP